MLINDLDKVVTQKELAGVLGCSGPTVTDYKQSGVIEEGQTALEWIRAIYIHHREQAAGRAAAGHLDLAQERAALAREQRLIAALKRERMEKKQAPVELLTLALARASSQVAAALDALVPRIKRRAPDLPASALVVVEEEIAAARNVAADVEIDLDDFDADTGNSGNTQGDSDRAEAA